MGLPIPKYVYGAYSILRPAAAGLAAAGFTMPAAGAQVADCSLMLSPGAPVMMNKLQQQQRASR